MDKHLTIIRIFACFTLAPFFKKEIEEKFLEIRTHEEWIEAVDYKSECARDFGGPFFKFDTVERAQELEAYGNGAFRMILVGEFFTPTFRVVSTDRFIKECIDAVKGKVSTVKNISIDADEFQIWLYIFCIWRLENHFKKFTESGGSLTLKIKISQGGLGSIVVELHTPGNDQMAALYNSTNFHKDPLQEALNMNSDELYGSDGSSFKSWASKNFPRAENVGVFLKTIRDTEKLNSLNDEMFRHKPRIFYSYLNFIGIELIHYFLKLNNEDKEDEKPYLPLRKLLSDLKLSGGDSIFKEPWKVSYEIPGTRGGTPPIRHFMTMYYFQGLSNLDAEKNEANKDEFNKGQFIKKNAHELLSLGYSVTDGRKNSLPYTKFEQDDLVNKDSSTIDASFSLLYSDVFIVGNSSHEQFRYFDNLIDYEEYWNSLFKILCHIVECKTLLSVLARIVLEERYKYGQDSLLFSSNATMQLKRLAKVSSLLQRVHKGLLPMDLTRIPFMNKKVKEFINELGVEELEKSVSQDIEALRSSIYNDFQHIVQKKMKRATSIILFSSLAMLAVAIFSVWVSFNVQDSEEKLISDISARINEVDGKLARSEKSAKEMQVMIRDTSTSFVEIKNQLTIFQEKVSNILSDRNNKSVDISPAQKAED